jgi:hypothetical protein
MRRRLPPPPPEEDDALENALDTLLERVKVQWYPREVWAKMRFEDDYENLVSVTENPQEFGWASNEVGRWLLGLAECSASLPSRGVW